MAVDPSGHQPEIGRNGAIKSILRCPMSDVSPRASGSAAKEQ
jgi:hypothetical protein